VAAELLHLALSDPELHQELARRAVARVDAYDPARAAAALRGAIEKVEASLSSPPSTE
jgi:hypothetical protein